MSPNMTTVKVSKKVRDRLSVRARKRRMTADAYISQLVDADEWLEQMEDAAAAMRSTSSIEWDEYLAESAEWDTAESEPI